MENRTFTAFVGERRLTSGTRETVVEALWQLPTHTPALVFDDETGAQVELDLSAPPAAEAPRGVGRPKLGVVAREVTLLSRHWEWLSQQPGGASVALRKLVEEARKSGGEKERVRRSQEAAYRFLSATAGNLPGFEEATRALFAGSAARFAELTAPWPADLRDYGRKLAEGALG